MGRDEALVLWTEEQIHAQDVGQETRNRIKAP